MNSAVRRSRNTSLAMLSTSPFPLYSSYFRSDARASPASPPWNICFFPPGCSSPAGHTSSFSLIFKSPGLAKVTVNQCNQANTEFLYFFFPWTWSAVAHRLDPKTLEAKENVRENPHYGFHSIGIWQVRPFALWLWKPNYTVWSHQHSFSNRPTLSLSPTDLLFDVFVLAPDSPFNILDGFQIWKLMIKC